MRKKTGRGVETNEDAAQNITVALEQLRAQVARLVEAARKAHLALQIGHNDYTDYGLASAIRQPEPIGIKEGDQQ